MRIVITVLFIMLFALNPALAATGAPDTGAMNELLRIFENTAGQWPAIIQPITTWLFWSLVTISWAWGFGEMALKGADIKELLAELFKRTFMVGFFWWLLISAPRLAAAIVNGFTWIGGQLAGSSAAYTSISPSSIFDIGISLVTKILKKLSVTDPIDSLGYVLVAIGIIVIFAFITLQLMVLIIQYYFFLNAGVVMMGFLGHEWSREYGINYFKLMIGLGVKYLTMQLIIVLTLDITQRWLKESDLTWTQLIIILPTMIIIWGLIREVPQMAQSLVSGTDQTTGNAVAGAMQAAAAMAAIAAGAFAAAGGASKMMQGAGNMSQLLQGAWNEASGGDGEASTNESDPATGPPPDSASNDSGDNNGASDGESDSGSGAESSSSNNATSNAEPSPSNSKKSFAAKATLTAGIAGKAIGNEIKGSAKNAFKSGMSKFTAPFSTPSNSIIGRAAQSIKSKDK
ncbi:P-type conjugative transfer protein TrbL [Moritella viscosa]|uniref:P-type conjugative transfer protein TrbL n=1 Tax=Moritella viscosa TaxID=80854 RepID=UPI0009164EC1|nr:P-type conjugative transfer protein TrbL [Moritella viscosa]SHO23814.1 P-type conjugative transfer protein TrbL [Moritella viscosa]